MSTSQTLQLFPARVAFVDPRNGLLTPEAYRALNALLNRVGGAQGDTPSVDQTQFDDVTQPQPADDNDLLSLLSQFVDAAQPADQDSGLVLPDPAGVDFSAIESLQLTPESQMTPALHEYGYIDVRQETTYALTTTPTVVNPAVVVSVREPISWNSSNGEVTFKKEGVYSLVLMLNPDTTAKRDIYTYATADTGAGHAILRWSARQIEAPASSTTQAVFVSTNYFASGTKLKFYLWANSAFNLVTTDLPGTTPGTVTVPSVRLLYTGAAM